MKPNSARRPPSASRQSSASAFPCQNVRKFPTNTSCSVFIQHIDDDGSLWVLPKSEVDTLAFVNQYMKNHVSVGQGTVNFAVNDIVSGLDTDGCWYRAKILGKRPLRIQFIDYGNSTRIASDHLAPLPPALFNVQPLTIKVKLAPESKIIPSYGDEMLVNYVTSENGIAVVRIVDSMTHELQGKQQADGGVIVEEPSTVPSEIGAETISDAVQQDATELPTGELEKGNICCSMPSESQDSDSYPENFTEEELSGAEAIAEVLPKSQLFSVVPKVLTESEEQNDPRGSTADPISNPSNCDLPETISTQAEVVGSEYFSSLETLIEPTPGECSEDAAELHLVASDSETICSLKSPPQDSIVDHELSTEVNQLVPEEQPEIPNDDPISSASTVLILDNFVEEPSEGVTDLISYPRNCDIAESNSTGQEAFASETSCLPSAKGSVEQVSYSFDDPISSASTVVIEDNFDEEPPEGVTDLISHPRNCDIAESNSTGQEAFASETSCLPSGKASVEQVSYSFDDPISSASTVVIEDNFDEEPPEGVTDLISHPRNCDIAESNSTGQEAFASETRCLPSGKASVEQVSYSFDDPISSASTVVIEDNFDEEPPEGVTDLISHPRNCDIAESNSTGQEAFASETSCLPSGKASVEQVSDSFGQETTEVDTIPQVPQVASSSTAMDSNIPLSKDSDAQAECSSEDPLDAEQLETVLPSSENGTLVYGLPPSAVSEIGSDSEEKISTISIKMDPDTPLGEPKQSSADPISNFRYCDLPETNSAGPEADASGTICSLETSVEPDPRACIQNTTEDHLVASESETIRSLKSPTHDSILEYGTSSEVNKLVPEEQPEIPMGDSISAAPIEVVQDIPSDEPSRSCDLAGTNSSVPGPDANEFRFTLPTFSEVSTDTDTDASSLAATLVSTSARESVDECSSKSTATLDNIGPSAGDSIKQAESHSETSEMISAIPLKVDTKLFTPMAHPDPDVLGSRASDTVPDSSNDGSSDTVSCVLRKDTSETVPHKQRDRSVRRVADASIAVDVSSSMSDGGLNAAAKVFTMSEKVATVPSNTSKGYSSRSFMLPAAMSLNREEPKDNGFLSSPKNAESGSYYSMEFELNIIREQNRIQMLELQRKMEQELMYQTNSIKQEMFRHLSLVGQKIANVFAEITLLKNDLEMIKYRQSGTSSGTPNTSSELHQNQHIIGNVQDFQHKATADYNVPPQNNAYQKDKSTQGSRHTSSFIPQNHYNQHCNRDSFPSQFKMDSFQSSASAHKNVEQPSDSMKSKCIWVKNIPEKVTFDQLYNLFGVYGCVHKIKMLQPGTALIEMNDAAQAAAASEFLINVSLMGSKLHVAPARADSVKMTQQDMNSDIAKDFTKIVNHKQQHDKWSADKLGPPLRRLKIFNVLSSVSDEKIKDVFANKGFHIVHMNSLTCKGNKEKKIVYASFHSVEQATDALAVMNKVELTDFEKMRITFSNCW